MQLPQLCLLSSKISDQNIFCLVWEVKRLYRFFALKSTNNKILT